MTSNWKWSLFFRALRYRPSTTTTEYLGPVLTDLMASDSSFIVFYMRACNFLARSLAISHMPCAGQSRHHLRHFPDTHLDDLDNLAVRVAPVNALAHFHHNHVPAPAIDKCAVR